MVTMVFSPSYSQIPTSSDYMSMLLDNALLAASTANTENTNNVTSSATEAVMNQAVVGAASPLIELSTVPSPIRCLPFLPGFVGTGQGGEGTNEQDVENAADYDDENDDANDDTSQYVGKIFFPRIDIDENNNASMNIHQSQHDDSSIQQEHALHVKVQIKEDRNLENGNEESEESGHDSPLNGTLQPSEKAATTTIKCAGNIRGKRLDWIVKGNNDIKEKATSTLTTSNAGPVVGPKKTKKLSKGTKKKADQSAAATIVGNACMDGIEVGNHELVHRNATKPCDIFSHRGTANTKHPGNMIFRDLISTYKPKYDANYDEVYRRNLAREIVEKLRPGRFLKMHSSHYFRVVDYESAVTKTLFAMRDCKTGRKRKATSLNPSTKRRRTDDGNSTLRDSTNDSTTTGPSAFAEEGNNNVSQPTPNRFTRTKRKTVTPPNQPSQPLTNDLTASEVRRIKFLIDQSVTPRGVKTNDFSVPMTRSEEIFTAIEKLAERGADARRKAGTHCIDQEWFHPEMQKCVKLQVLQRCKLAMEITGMKHNEFFDKLFAKLFGIDIFL